MCSGFKPKARFYGLLGLKNRHFYAVPGTAGKSSSADKPRGSPKAPENSRITTVFLHSLEEARQTVQAAAFITTILRAQKDIPWTTLSPELPEPNLISVLLNVVPCTEPQILFSPLVCMVLF